MWGLQSLSGEIKTEIFLLAIVEPTLRGDVDSPARLETALQVGELQLLEVGGIVLVPTATAPCTQHTGGGRRRRRLGLLPLLHNPGLLAGQGRGGALHLLLLHVEVDGVLVLLVSLLSLGGLLLEVPGVEEHL